MIRLFGAVISLLILTACGGGGGGTSTPAPTPPPTSSNNPPSANAGSDQSVSISTSGYNLDGTGSSDPDNNSITYSWTLITEPEAGAASLTNQTSASPSFTTMIPGNYEFQLTVTDTSNATNTDTVVVTLVNDAPTISLSTYATNVAIGQDLLLDASGSTDSNGHSLTYEWNVTSAPTDSFLVKLDGSMPTVEFDKAGDYTIELTVSDGHDSTTQVLDVFTVDPHALLKLSSQFSSAEYSSVTNRVVTLENSVLTIIEADDTVKTVNLPRAGQAVSVAPDGETAAIAHDGWISHVDLSAASVIDSVAVPANLSDVVIDGNNNAYGFPATGQWVSIYNVNLVNKNITQTGTIRHRTVARLHPSGQKMYGADNGISPSDLERYTISGGQVSEIYDSPYHGDYPFCGDLWMGPDGGTILSRCKVIVRASDNRSTDLTYVSQLDNGIGSISWADASDFSRRWYTIGYGATEGSENINVYDADNFQLINTLEFPDSNLGGSGKWFTKFIFADDDSDILKILAVDDAVSPTESVLLTVYEMGSDLSDPAPVAVTEKFRSVRTSDNVTLDASASYDPNGFDITYSWTLNDQPSGSSITPTGLNSAMVEFTPALAGTYEFALTIDNGSRQSAAKIVSVNVFEPNADIIHRLEGSMVDIDYSKSLNKAIYLSDTEAVAFILDLSDLSVNRIALDRLGYSVGVSPNGMFAAISHAGNASLIDLSTETVSDTQEFAADRGDIALDDNNIAYLIPSRDQHVDLHSIDFAQNRTDSSYGPYAGSRTRIHPTRPLVMAADRSLSPSDFEQWDTSTFPASGYRDSPYHGDYSISGNIWIHEDGTRSLVAGGNSFHSTTDQSTDMTYAGALSDMSFVKWADASTEKSEWAVITGSDKIHFYDDQFLNRSSVSDLGSIPTTNGDVATSGSYIFYSDDGNQLFVVLNGNNLTDSLAIQIME